TKGSGDHAEMNSDDEAGSADMNGDRGMEGMDHAGAGMAMGLSQAENGFAIAGVTAPTETGSEGQLALTVTDTTGQVVTDFEREHEKELHLIVVRADGQQFRHVHPTMDPNGQWTIPWSWDEAGEYRVFADFVPAGGDGLTLSTTVSVNGDFTAAPAETEVTTSDVDSYEVSVAGDLIPGQNSALTLSVTDGGAPVTALEPYLGAFGHLVALREGDLAYMHVHPEGEEPDPDDLSGPDVTFMA
ncbi:heavy-metal-associated domain-containing protein, partial [Burkholderia multivorans]